MAFGFWEAILSHLTRQVGLRTDAADAAGSLHAKVKDVRNNLPVTTVQRGITTLGESTGNLLVNVTISSVNLSKTFLTVSYSTDASGTFNGDLFPRARLTSSTNLEFFRRDGSGTPGATTYVAWEVIQIA